MSVSLQVTVIFHSNYSILEQDSNDYTLIKAAIVTSVSKFYRFQIIHDNILQAMKLKEYSVWHTDVLCIC